MLIKSQTSPAVVPGISASSPMAAIAAVGGTLVYAQPDKKFVGLIWLPPVADRGTSDEPWMLMWHSGRIDRFSTQRAAKAEARKSWANCVFQRAKGAT